MKDETDKPATKLGRDSRTGTPLRRYQGQVKVKHLKGKEALEFRKRMGLDSSSLIIGNTIFGNKTLS